MATKGQRNQLAADMEFLHAWNSHIGYSNARPMPYLHFSSRIALHAYFSKGDTISPDCSGSLVLLCKWAGLKDPTGYNYSGNGNTQNMYDHLHQRYTNPAQAQVGAIGVYGSKERVGLSRQHAIMVLHPGRDPIVFSHGSAAGPLILPLHSESAAHPGVSLTFLSIGDL